MQEINFLSKYNKATQRDYVGRVVESDKATSATIAKQWGKNYWDGDRNVGYGGYHYDGRWLTLAEEIAKFYNLKAGDRILDIGCGKAFLLYEFTRAVPGIQVQGIDVSEYGIEHGKTEIKSNLKVANATQLPFDDGTFDFVYSINVFHNLHNYELMAALQEIQRVSKQRRYVCVESYRNEREKANLLYWQLTCESFYTPKEWQWFFELSGYGGDYGFIYFE